MPNNPLRSYRNNVMNWGWSTNEKYWWTKPKHPNHEMMIHRRECQRANVSRDDHFSVSCHCKIEHADPISKLEWFQDISGGEYGL